MMMTMNSRSYCVARRRLRGSSSVALLLLLLLLQAESFTIGGVVSSSSPSSSSSPPTTTITITTTTTTTTSTQQLMMVNPGVERFLWRSDAGRRKRRRLPSLSTSLSSSSAYDEGEGNSGNNNNNSNNNEYEEYIRKLQNLAKNTSRDPTAISQAKELVDEITAASIADTNVYNLLIEVYAYSTNAEEDTAEQAQQILMRMMNHQDGDIVDLPKPNIETYGKVMDAWTRQKRIDKVEEIFHLATTKGDKNMQPDIFLYNKLIKAYGVVRDAEKAESILLNELLLPSSSSSQQQGKEGEEEDGIIPLPNTKTWVHVMRAYTLNPNHKEVALEKVQSLMDRMMIDIEQEHGVNPYDVNIRNALLRAMSMKSRKGRQSYSKDAEKILYEMIEMYNKAIQDDDHEGARANRLKPNEDTFYYVFLSFCNNSANTSKDSSSVPFKIEKLMELQKALDIKPTLRNYKAAISAMIKSSDPRKAIRAQKLMSNAIDDDNMMQPDLAIYKLLLKCCAYTNATSIDDAKIKFQVFQIAVEAFNELRGGGGGEEKSEQQQQQQPDSSSVYGLFLMACKNLIAQSNPRKCDTVVENVFRKCCNDGYVNNFVLTQFEKVASDELVLRILGGFVEDDVRLPSEWSRNVVDEDEHKREEHRRG